MRIEKKKLIELLWRLLYWTGFAILFSMFMYQIIILWIQHSQEITVQVSSFMKQDLKDLPHVTLCAFPAYKFSDG